MPRFLRIRHAAKFFCKQGYCQTFNYWLEFTIFVSDNPDEEGEAT